MELREMFLPIRAWWYLRIMRSSTIPPDIGPYLMALRERNSLALNHIEKRRQATIDTGAANGKTISTEAALKYVLELKNTYDGPDREEYAREIDRFVDEFRKEHGPHLPADEAYALLKELEAPGSGESGRASRYPSKRH